MSWGIHIWNTKLSSYIEEMQTTRTINLVQSLPLVPFLLGVTELELSQQPSGQLQQTVHFCLPALKAFLRKRVVEIRQQYCPGDGHLLGAPQEWQDHREQHPQPYGWRDSVSHQASLYTKPAALLTDVCIICSCRLPGLRTAHCPQAAANDLCCPVHWQGVGIYSSGLYGAWAGNPVR